MPTSNEIIKLGITVSSASVTRAGFDSMLLVGDETMVDPTEVGPSGTGTFDPTMVYKYTAYSQVGDELANGYLKDMVKVAFGQQPSVGTVYVSYVDTSGTNEGITSSDITAMHEEQSDWIGYCSTFDSASDVATQAGSLVALGKFYSVVTDSTATPATTNDFMALWHTKVALDNPASSGYYPESIGRWANVASLSYYLASVQGSYNPAFKGLQLITPNKYSATEETALRAANLNQYSNIGGQDLTWDGKNASGKGYIDTYLGALYLQIRLTEDLMNMMIQTPKLPYTDGGISTVGSVIDNRLAQCTSDGYLDETRPYQISLPVASQLSDRASRVLPNVSFIAYTTGAINTIEIQGFIDAT